MPKRVVEQDRGKPGKILHSPKCKNLGRLLQICNFYQ